MPLATKKTPIQTKGRREFSYGSDATKDRYLGSSETTVISGASYHAGANIQIDFDNTINATDTKYYPGHNIEITSGNVINAIGEAYTAGENITITSGNVINAVDTKYTAGHNIEITSGNVINALAEQYQAGDNINISGNVISTSANVHSDAVHNIVVCTQSEYDSMQSHDANTLYLIIEPPAIVVSPTYIEASSNLDTGSISVTSAYQWRVTIKDATNCILYIAYDKLPEVTDTSVKGLHINQFTPTISGHTSLNLFTEVNGNILFTNNLTSIGERAFYGCSGITQLDIPDSVTSIGEGAFRSCTNMTGITMPSSLTSIGDEAFSECYNLYDFNYNGTMAQWSNVTLGNNWKRYAPFTGIYCSDGYVPI